MVAWIKGTYFWTMAVIVTTFYFLWCAVEQFFIVIFNRPRDGRRVHRVCSRWGRAIIRLMPGWKIDVQGKEHLPKDSEPVIFVANHESMSDICAMYYLGVQFRWLSKDSVFKVPGVGQAMTWARYVQIGRAHV